MNTAVTEASIENHAVVSKDQWVARRKELLAREKELTHLRDQIARERRALPWVRIDKNYVFQAPDGRRTLAELFDGRHQLVVQHFMFAPGWEEGCKSCSFMADHIEGMRLHLAQRDVTLLVVSRAPLPEIERFRQRMGWQFKWVSSNGSDFNYDFHVSFDEDKAPLEYNYKDRETLAREAPYIRPGTDGPGVSVFLREDDRVFHTYSAYQRGLDSLLGAYRWLDLTPLGRQRHVTGFPYHDAYDQQP